MNAVDWMISVSAHYPALANLLIALSIFCGVMAIIGGIYLALEVNVFMTKSPSQVTTMMIIGCMLGGSMLISLGYTMDVVGNTLFDFGGAYVLEAFAGTEEWKLQSGLTPQKALQAFTLMTLKLSGILFGFWGCLTFVRTNRPDSDAKMSAALTRIAVGAALFNPVKLLNLFGGFGNKFFS